MKRDIQAKNYKETEGMTYEELREYDRKGKSIYTKLP
jgi:hypothetical protein